MECAPYYYDAKCMQGLDPTLCRLPGIFTVEVPGVLNLNMVLQI